MELVEPTHPLIQWIRDDFANDPQQLHPVSAVQLAAEVASVPVGDYVFMTHRWSFVGLRTDHLLAYRAVRVGADQTLDSSVSEVLVTAATRHGRSLPNAANLIGELVDVANVAATCDEVLQLDFAERANDFEAENELRCGQQETTARRFADRRIKELNERLDRFRAQGNMRPIPMTEGLLRKEETQLLAKLARIERRRQTDPTIVPLAVGVIRVN